MKTLNALPSDSAPPASARAVIVGGGIMGCALAYHLARAGWDTVLLEKGELTSGSTWHAAGQITRATANASLCECVDYNIKLYQRLQEETGQSATWHGCGSLRMAYTEDEEDWLRHIASALAGRGFPAEMVAPSRIRELHPFYGLDGIRCALHTPDDGHVDPAGAAFALAKGARLHGAKIVRRCRVTGIQKTASGEWRVCTERGEVVCDHVVNAGGMFARQIALWNDYDLPAVSMTHHYFVTGAVAEFAALERELPVVRDDRTVSGYVRMEQQSGLVGVYEKQNPNSVWDDGVPWESEHELFTPDYDRTGDYLARALARMPVLEAAGIRRVVHGAISYPPDAMPLIGPAPGLQNYWCCCGCQIGIGWGPGLALHLSRWMTGDGADINMRDFDPRRFGAWANRDYQMAKARESYELQHETPFPNFNRPAARPGVKSPLYEKLKQKGAIHEAAGGWERPRWFAKNNVAQADIYSFRRDSVLHSVVGAEVAKVRAAAGVMDISAFAKVEVCGAGAAAFLDSLIPNRLPSPGRIALAHLLDDNGRIVLETTVMRVDEQRFYLACAAFFQTRLLDYFRPHPDSVQIYDRTAEMAALTINGPQARLIVADCFPAAADLLRLQIRPVAFAGAEILACRMSYTGESGWEFHGAPSAVSALYDALEESGKPRGLADYGSFAMNAMRMEKAFPGAGELTNEVRMSEAGVMRFADLTKTFPGKNALVRENPRWRLIYMEIAGDGEHDGAGGESVFCNGVRAGCITSVAFGHSVGKLLAFAYIRADTDCGGELNVVLNGEMRPAKILSAPAYDPKNAVWKES